MNSLLRKAIMSLGRLTVAAPALVLALLVLLFAFPMVWAEHPLISARLLELQLAWSSETFTNVAHAWGLSGINTFLSTMWLDFVFPPIYALALASLVALAWRSSPSSLLVQMPFVAPFIAALLDYAENLLQVMLLSGSEPYSSTLVLLASGFASLKWGLILASLLSALAMGIRLLLKRAEPPPGR